MGKTTWSKVPIKEFEELYAVSDAGDVFSKRSHRLMSAKYSKTGYARVTLCNDGYQKTVSVHRLVAMAFVDNPNGKPTVNHKNEIKSDNRAENLEWATNAEQNVYGTRIARAVSHTDWAARTKRMDYKEIARKHNYAGQHMCNRKRTRVYKDGAVVGEYRTQKEAGKAAGVSKSNVSQCVSGKIKSCKGYVFEEIEEFPIAVTKLRFPE